MADINKLVNNIKTIVKDNQIPLNKLMTPDFISSHTKHNDFDRLLACGGFEITDEKQFNLFPSNDWEAYITRQTQFISWREMRMRAMVIYVGYQITLDD